MSEPSKTTATPHSSTSTSALGIGFIVCQLILIALILHQVDMLPLAFRRVVYLAVPGFLVNHLLPSRFRLPFFALLSISGLFLALGIPTEPDRFWNPIAIARASMVLLCGAVLVGICHLPISFWKRSGLLLASAVILAAFRTGVFPSEGIEIIWIVVPMIFMFRIVIYLYDLSTSATRPTTTQTLGYFLLFPIASFSTLIPIVDFKTFCRSHYNEMPLAIYQRGVRWMARGVIQILLFRYIDQVFAIDFERISNGTDLARFLITGPLLYLNVSGHFHFSIGLLLLFGFNLPETNHRYFLASSFTDLWRRANIYWKDFMMKIFYYPAYFRLKKLGHRPALIIATLWIFLLSWALHVYLIFWSSGSLYLSGKHLLFWVLVGSLVLANSLWEMRGTRKRTLTISTVSAAEALGLSVQTAGTFVVMWFILFSFARSPTISAWLGLWRFADWHTLAGIVATILVIMAVKLGWEILPARRRKQPVAALAAIASRPILWRRDGLLCAAPLLGLCVLTGLAINSRLPDPGLQRFAPQLNIQRFYDLLEAGNSLITEGSTEELNPYKKHTYFREGNRQLEEIFIGRPIPRFAQSVMPPVRETHDYRAETLEPGRQVPAYEAIDFQTNRWGMRDRDYEVTKPAHIRRIALLGSADDMGYGVKQNEMFETLLEEQLNRNAATGESSTGWELLNFSHAGYSPLAQIDVLRLHARAFSPDIVILVGRLSDFGAINHRLRTMQRMGDPIPDKFPQKILTDARVIRYINLGLAEKRLRPYESALVAWSLQRIAEECRAFGAAPIFVFLPDAGATKPITTPLLEKARSMNGMAQDAGFTVIDLSHVYDGVQAKDLVTGRIPHGSARAHRLIAEALSRQLTTGPALEILKRVQAKSAAIK